MSAKPISGPISGQNDTKDTLPGNAFLAVLQRKELQDSTLTELSEKLSEAAIAVVDTGKKASVSLTLNLEPKNGAIHFSTKITTKVPVGDQRLCLFYVDPATGEITRQDPNQKEFELTVTPGSKAESPAPTSVAAVS